VIIGIGIDVVEINRIEKAIKRRKRFAQRVFTEAERDYCLSHKHSGQHFAVRFAAKEAVLKSLGSGMRGVKWTDFEIGRDKLGKPFLTLSGAAAKIAHEKGIKEIMISLSFSKESAVAQAIAIGA
jgi:holo-[acyl-carrier protein] synthase